MAPKEQRRRARVSYRPADAFKDIDFGSGDEQARQVASSSEEDEHKSGSEFGEEAAAALEASSSTSVEQDDAVESESDAAAQEPSLSGQDSIVDASLTPPPNKGKRYGKAAPKPPARILVVPSASAASSKAKAVRHDGQATFNRYHPRMNPAGDGFVADVLTKAPGEPVKSLLIGRSFGPISEGRSVHLNKPFADPSNAPGTSNAAGLAHRSAKSVAERENVQAAWAGTMSGPLGGLVEDTAWSKGKRSHPTRWGAWTFPDNAVRSMAFEEAAMHFPNATRSAKDEEEDAKFDSTGAVHCQVCSGKRPPATVRMERFSALPLASAFPTRPGFMLNAGAPVWSLDWCPQADIDAPAPMEYLAIATTSCHPALGEFARSSASEAGNPVQSMLQIWSLDCSNTRLFKRAVDTTSIEDEESLTLALGICVDVGEAWQLKWCPRGGSREDDDATCLGILAGCFTDGKVHLFAIPQPPIGESTGVQYFRAEPIVSLSLPDTNLTTLDWSSHERLVCGAENGWVAVWDLTAGDITAKAEPMLTQYFPVHASGVRKVAVILAPPVDASFKENDGSEPQLLSTSSMDGSVSLIDLRDPSISQVLVHERSVNAALVYSSQLGGLLISDQDHFTCFTSIRPRTFSAHSRLFVQSGFTHDVAASPFHPFVAAASADGTCVVDNAIRHLRQKQHAVNVVDTLYRIDFDRTSLEYRMLDALQPERATAKDNASRAAKNATALTIGAWASEVGVHCVSWCKSIRRAGLLASGSASGLVRLDCVQGVE